MPLSAAEAKTTPVPSQVLSPNSRKIRFADEHGLELAQYHYYTPANSPRRSTNWRVGITMAFCCLLASSIVAGVFLLLRR